MPTKPKKVPDYRSRLYKSVRISIKAYDKIDARRKKERRTFVATADLMLGV